jgi:hypothetical protein
VRLLVLAVLPRVGGEDEGIESHRCGRPASAQWVAKITS